MTTKAATREDIDEVLDVMRQFMQQVGDEFGKTHESSEKNTKDIQKILTHLDSIEKQLEISEDERLVIGHQLERVNTWVHSIANKIGYELGA